MKEQKSSINQHQKFVKPLSAGLALGQQPTIKEPRLVNDLVVWLEQRPDENGRTTALLRPWGRADLSPQELTPAPINLRSRVHEYGGGVLAIASEGNQIYITWINDSDGCLWAQSFEDLRNSKDNNDCWVRPLHQARCLSLQGDFCLADGLIDLFRRRWLGVMEIDGSDLLVTYSLDEDDQKAKIVHRPFDFAGYAALSPKGDQLVWIEWQQPSMPWEVSQLWWASLDQIGTLSSVTLLAGNSIEQENPISVFQPIWLSNGQLVVSEDASGCSNLMITGPSITPNSSPRWRRLWPMNSETSMPQWVYGMSTTSPMGNKIISANCLEGKWKLNLLTPDGLVSDVDQPFNDLAGLYSHSSRAVVIASNPTQGPGLLELDLNSGSSNHIPSTFPVLQESEISVPESFWFKGYQEKLTHAWYYPPSDGTKGIAPLLVKSHSGPTAMASPGLNLSIQFWTSRGWGVVDVNYGGSSGFGRQYRSRLNYGWGVVDVFDCEAAAKALIELGRTNPELIAIEGGSAGGFTTLSCLCFSDIFRVGACRYGVSDLLSMAKDTHRFESCYLDYLIGSLPEDIDRYEQRSPLMNAHKITCPVIFFQGMKDKVVPPEQTEIMVAALRKNNVPVEFHQFSNEGHGFKDHLVKIKVLEETETFFRKYLDL